MNAKYTGGCLCGAIRYSSDVDPVFTGNCHCKDCQRATGSAFTPAMFFSEPAVHITGSPAWYRSTADSGNTIDRGFCPTCGSQLFSKLQAMPGFFGLKAGTLDDSSLFKPAMDIYVRSAAHWDPMDAALPKHDAAPTR